MAKKLFLIVATLTVGACTIAKIVQDNKRNPQNIKPNSIPIVNILKPNILSQIENTGFSLNQLLNGDGVTKSTQDLFSKNPYYASIANTIGRKLTHTSPEDQLPKQLNNNIGDVPEMVKELRKITDNGGTLRPPFKITQLANDAHHPYKVVSDGDEPRHFDQRWLYSPYGEFPLTAIVNRIDKMDMYPNSCGEVRFIYRLSYKTEKASSSMPFFLNVVLEYPKDKACDHYAQKWFIDSDLNTNEGLAKIKLAFTNLKLKQIELNFQSLRFPSGYMHDFGGQAMYIQRVFKIDEQKKMAYPIFLENTPHVYRVNNNQSLKIKLANYIKNNLKAIDEGTVNLNFNNPVDNEQILSKRSISWSTLGRARSVNKPYRSIFKSEADKNLLPTDQQLAKLDFIKTRAGLLERLDNRTCVGCHQSGGTAGFHLLGYPKNEFSHGFNRQQLPLSAHAFAESSRREAYVKALAIGGSPNRFRPHSTFSKARTWREQGVPSFDNLKTRDLCIIQKTNAFTNNPTCGSTNGKASKCIRTVSVNDSELSTLVGECVEDNSSLAGSICFKASMNEVNNNNKNFDLLAFQDNLKSLTKIQSCGSPKGGAPLGRKSKKCTAEQEMFRSLKAPIKNKPAELCANRGGNGFDVCAASGDAGSCLENRVARSMLDTCNPGHFCREDYICQMFPDYDLIEDKYYQKLKRGKPVNLAKFSAQDKAHIKNVVTSLRDENEIGFCVPTYFLFNMRTDGHPNPITGKADGFPKINPKLPLRGI